MCCLYQKIRKIRNQGLNGVGLRHSLQRHYRQCKGVTAVVRMGEAAAVNHVLGI